MPTTQQSHPERPVTSNIRVPAELWERLRERAFSEHVSINALIVQAISEKLDHRSPLLDKMPGRK